MRFLAVALLAACADAVIKVGDTLPAVTLDYGAPLPALVLCGSLPPLSPHRSARAARLPAREGQPSRAVQGQEDHPDGPPRRLHADLIHAAGPGLP